MVVMRHRIRYQGLLATGAQYSRTEGLDPDHGWVLLPLVKVKRVLVREFDFGQWRAASGFEFDGALDIRSWEANRRLQTVSTPVELARDPAGGLNRFGRLKFTTVVESAGGEKKLRETEYVDVYVDDAGIEDLAEKIARQRKHDVGTLFVPLSDVRKFYKDYGPFYGRINVRRPDGTWEEGSTRGPNDPWPAELVVRFLFGQLPGSPIVRESPKKANTLDDDSLFLDPPTDVVGEGEPAKEWLDKVLDELGMMPKYQPDGTYLVVRSNASAKYDRIPFAPGRTKKPTRMHAETQTVTLSSRPELVMVRGKKRIRRTTEPCIAVLRDDNGDIRPLEDVIKEHGYPELRLRINAIASPETAFEDVPPQPKDVESFRLHKLRREMYKQMAFKAYAPLANMVERERDGKTVLDPVLAREHLAPMRDFAIYLSEFKTLGRRIPADSEKKKGDREDYIIARPLVRAVRFTETVFRDFDEIRARFKFLIGIERDSIKFWNDTIEQWRARAKNYGKNLLRSSIEMPTSYKQLKAKTEYRVRSGLDADFITLDDDVNRLAGLTDQFGGTNHRILQRDMTEKNVFAVNRVKELAANEKLSIKRIKEITDAIRVLQAEFRTFRNAWVDTQGVVLVANEPYSIVPEGEYDIERDTGLITFKDVAGHMRRPFVLDSESPEDALGLVTDGQVTVTFGHEFHTGTVLDYTAVLVGAKTVPKFKAKVKFEAGRLAVIPEPVPGKDVIPIAVGLARSTPLKPRVAHAPEMILYEADEGTPMNVTSVATEAVQRAGGLVTAPPAATGFTYQLSGLHLATLDVGVSVVQHEWPVNRDKGTARTTVAVNSPFARGLLAGVPTVRRVQAFRARAREVMLSDMENTR